MDLGTQTVPGYFVWEAPGGQLTVHLQLQVVDRMLAEVMRGFGAVPKRGAEVGGVLLGTVDESDGTIVRIEDFESVPCEYRQGPSYLLTADERQAFDDSVARWMPGEENRIYAVGYFRSHTRDGLTLASEDLEILNAQFPQPWQVALLVKPYATKVSMAGFLTRQDGSFPDEEPVQFPFRRRELTGEEAPPRRSLYERRPRARPEPPAPTPQGHGETPYAGDSLPPTESAGDASLGYPESYYPPDAALGEEEEAVYAPDPSDSRAWTWIPLSLLFLLLGLALGFFAAPRLSPEFTNAAQNPNFALNLSVERDGDNLVVRWDRTTAAVQAAQSGLLEIEDGGYTKPVDLEPADLQNGTVIYQNSTNSVRFRLMVYLDPRLMITETLEWRQ